MALNRLLERIKGRISEASSGSSADRTGPVISDGTGLVPVDEAFLYKGLFIGSDVYIMIDEKRYLLFCRNAEMDDALEEKLERILEGSDHMVYVSEEYADRLADMAVSHFGDMEDDQESRDSQERQDDQDQVLYQASDGDPV